MATTRKSAPAKTTAAKTAVTKSPTLEARHAKLAELEQLIAHERSAIAAERDGHIKGLWDDFVSRLTAAGSSIAEAQKVAGYKTPRGKAGGTKTETKPTGNKAPPKYLNPADGATWSGRGLNPKWMAEAIAKGKKKDEFLIK